MKVTVKKGSEGSFHDPYHFEHIVVHRWNGDVIECRFGLSCWTKLNGKIIAEHDEDDCEAAFEQYAGMKSYYAARVPDIIFERYLRSLPLKKREDILLAMAADEAMLRYAY